MAKLRCEKTAVVFKVDSADLDRFIKATFKFNFNYAYREGLASGSSREVEADDSYSEDELDCVKKEIDSDPDSVSVEDLLSYCASRGLIEAGTYIITFGD